MLRSKKNRRAIGYLEDRLLRVQVEITDIKDYCYQHKEKIDAICEYLGIELVEQERKIVFIDCKTKGGHDA
jgi:hypothetical protein